MNFFLNKVIFPYKFGFYFVFSCFVVIVLLRHMMVVFWHWKSSSGRLDASLVKVFAIVQHMYGCCLDLDSTCASAKLFVCFCFFFYL